MTNSIELGRRDTLRVLGAGAMLLGIGLSPGTALGQSDDNVLTEALVLRDPGVR